MEVKGGMGGKAKEKERQQVCKGIKLDNHDVSSIFSMKSGRTHLHITMI